MRCGTVPARALRPTVLAVPAARPAVLRLLRPYRQQVALPSLVLRPAAAAPPNQSAARPPPNHSPHNTAWLIIHFSPALGLVKLPFIQESLAPPPINVLHKNILSSNCIGSRINWCRNVMNEGQIICRDANLCQLPTLLPSKSINI